MNRTEYILKKAIIPAVILLTIGSAFSCEKSTAPAYSARGIAWDVLYFIFPPIEGAVIRIVEYPKMIAIADSNGHFSFDGLRTGSEVTFSVSKPGYYPYYSETFTIENKDLEPVATQIPSIGMYHVFAAASETIPQEGRGFIASTVSTRDPDTFTDMGFPGEPGCTVTIEPALPASLGPIYFDENTIPRRYLTATTGDGGVLYVNVPPGEYTLYAHKDGITFRPVQVKVFPGALTNATPPYGLRKM